MRLLPPRSQPAPARCRRRPACAPAPPPPPPPPPPPAPAPRLRLRRARRADAAALARLWHDAFAGGGGGGAPPSALGALAAALALPPPARPRSAAEWEAQFCKALDAQRAARLEAREYRLHRRAAALRAALGALRGGAAAAGARLPPETRAEAARVERWRRLRAFACFVAVLEGGGAGAPAGQEEEVVVGAAALSLGTPEARLPPPLPTRARTRACVSNVAVAPAHRRRGAGAALLAACERAARGWGFDAVFLGVEAGNAAARALYERGGYEVRASGGAPGAPLLLLAKPVAPLRPCGGGAAPAGVAGGTGAGGVYTWRLEPGDGPA